MSGVVSVIVVMKNANNGIKIRNLAKMSINFFFIFYKNIGRSENDAATYVRKNVVAKRII